MCVSVITLHVYVQWTTVESWVFCTLSSLQVCSASAFTAELVVQTGDLDTSDTL